MCNACSLTRVYDYMITNTERGKKGGIDAEVTKRLQKHFSCLNHSESLDSTSLICMENCSKRGFHSRTGKYICFCI